MQTISHPPTLILVYPQSYVVDLLLPVIPVVVQVASAPRVSAMIMRPSVDYHVAEKDAEQDHGTGPHHRQ